MDHIKAGQVTDNKVTDAKPSQAIELRVDARILQKQLTNDRQTRQALLTLLLQWRQGKFTVKSGINPKLEMLLARLTEEQVETLQYFLEAFDKVDERPEVGGLDSLLQLQLGHMIGYIKYSPDNLWGKQLGKLASDGLVDKLIDKKTIDPKILVSRPMAFTNKLDQLSPEIRNLILQSRKQQIDSQLSKTQVASSQARLQQRTKYRITVGDTLELIAQKKFRNERVARLIFQINQKVFLQRVIDGVNYTICIPGDEIWLPTPYEAVNFLGGLIYQHKIAEVNFSTAPKLSPQVEFGAKFGNGW